MKYTSEMEDRYEDEIDNNFDFNRAISFMFWMIVALCLSSGAVIAYQIIVHAWMPGIVIIAGLFAVLCNLLRN